MRQAAPVKVFEPASPREALHGWALHTTRRRKVHEAEARYLDRYRYLLGTLATCFAAVAGTSAFAAWQSDTKNAAAAILTAVVGVGAALLASAVTFLDLGGRAEGHRRSAAAYKGILRDFEEATGYKTATDDELNKVLQGLKPLLAEVDAAAPIVPEKRGTSIDSAPFSFVGTAAELVFEPSGGTAAPQP